MSKSAAAATAVQPRRSLSDALESCHTVISIRNAMRHASDPHPLHEFEHITDVFDEVLEGLAAIDEVSSRNALIQYSPNGMELVFDMEHRPFEQLLSFLDCLSFRATNARNRLRHMMQANDLPQS